MRRFVFVILVAALPCLSAPVAIAEIQPDVAKRFETVESHLNKVDETLKGLDVAALLKKVDDRLTAIDRKIPDATTWPVRLEAIAAAVKTGSGLTFLVLLVAVATAMASLAVSHVQQKRMSEAAQDVTKMVRAVIDRKTPLIVLGVEPARGPAAGGTPVQIRGRNFEEGAAVRFGSTVAPNGVVMSSEIIAVATPAGMPAGACDVSVQNRDGGSGTLPAAFTFVAAPVVVGVAPATSVPAGGGLVTVFGNHFDDASRIVFGGQELATIFGSPNHLTFAVPPQGGHPPAVTIAVRGRYQMTQWDGLFTYA